MPRLGLINYINSLPIVWPIQQGLVKLDAQVILAEPSELNALFASNELDYGAMSAFAYLSQDNLTLIPSVSISSLGAVNSVLLFSKKPVEKHSFAKVTVPSGSATSVNALLLLLSEYHNEMPEILTVVKPDLEDPMVDAALVIGDRALLIDKEWSQAYHRYDLGQWWNASFKLPMVFGVFAARTNWLLAKDIDSGLKLNSPLIEQLSNLFLEATKIGLGSQFNNVLAVAEQRTGLSRKRLEQYYKSDLDFGWSPEHSLGLQKYSILCQEKGILTAGDKKDLLKCK